MLLVWLKFLICALAIFGAGYKLTKYGDALAEKTGLCRAWVGLVLLAAVTSLPELANSISAVTLTHLPDLAIGDLLGACMMNMFSLALLGLIWGFFKKDTFFSAPKKGNLYSTLFGTIILLLVAAALFAGRLGLDFSLWGISVFSVIILVVYLVSLYLLQQHRDGDDGGAEKIYADLSLTRIYVVLGVAAGVVVLAGCWLPFIGAEIVTVMGWGKTFVAVLFLAIATTLPELTVSFSALRLGQVGMSIGNLVGSNVFDVSLIFLVDVLYRQGSLYSAVSPAMLYVALIGALLMGIFYLAMRKGSRSQLPAVLIIVIYLFSLFWLF